MVLAHQDLHSETNDSLNMAGRDSPYGQVTVRHRHRQRQRHRHRQRCAGDVVSNRPIEDMLI